MPELLDRITLDPKVRSGKPIIRGTRITVADILEYLAGGWGGRSSDRCKALVQRWGRPP